MGRPKAGFLNVAFVIDFYVRYIVGWQVHRTADAGIVVAALKLATRGRLPVHRGGVTHHSDRSSQYVSINVPNA
ncbi:hypothetical protein MTsN3n11_28380 [Qipengyuania sp. MTN3-11]